ncbi:MAG TPA: RecX family transcriptional regulator [Ktedonobacteraceae bacterium]|jgi:regulatory protein|nr:RecX family transcriptional regulator [Ktedonobacteraceae bacterium]
MRITAIEPQAHDAERFNLYVDGRFLLGVNASIVMQMGLQVQQELLPEQLEQLHSAELEQQAVDRALNYLSFRPRSREEVRRYLRRKETPPEIIEVALARLDRLDFVNDRNFASFWIETREQFNPRGARALKNELRMKGVNREMVDELVDDEQDEERALRAGRKKALSLVNIPGMDYTTFRNRLGSFLQRRGFGYQVSTHTVRQLWQELREDESAEPENDDAADPD